MLETKSQRLKMPFTCPSVDVTQLKKISDLEDKSTEITQTKVQRKTVEKSKRASKRYRIMSDGLINLMTKSKPQIQEVQKTSKQDIQTAENNNEEKILKAARR